jgi:hypothetical protein
LYPTALYLNAGEIRSNGLVKDEVRKSQSGYEKLRKVGVGTLGSELIVEGAWEDVAGNWSYDIDGNLVSTGADTSNPNQVGKVALGDFFKVEVTANNSNGIVLLGTVGTPGSFLNTINGTTSAYLTPSAANSTNVYLASSGGGVIMSNVSVKEVTAAEAIAADSTFTEIGSDVLFNLATPVSEPIAAGGLLNSNSNGTAYFEPAIADAGVYGTDLDIQLTDYPIASIESITKRVNGVDVIVDPATAVIAVDGLSFTHPDLANADLVTFIYLYDIESINRAMTLTHYDSRFVLVDSVDAKVYRIEYAVASGVLSTNLIEI